MSEKVTRKIPILIVQFILVALGAAVGSALVIYFQLPKELEYWRIKHGVVQLEKTRDEKIQVLRDVTETYFRLLSKQKMCSVAYFDKLLDTSAFILALEVKGRRKDEIIQKIEHRLQERIKEFDQSVIDQDSVLNELTGLITVVPHYFGSSAIARASDVMLALSESNTDSPSTELLFQEIKAVMKQNKDLEDKRSQIRVLKKAYIERPSEKEFHTAMNSLIQEMSFELFGEGSRHELD